MCTSLSRVNSSRTPRAEATRRRLLDATWELLQEEGAAATSLEAVARRAGITRRALYLHFGSRAELLMALRGHVDEAYDLAASVGPIGAAPTVEEAVAAWARHVARFHARIAPVIKALEAAAAGDDDVAALLRQSKSAWLGECRNLVRRIEAEGRLAPPWTVTQAADLLWSFMAVTFVDDLVTARRWTVTQLAERLTLVVHRAVMTAP